MNKAFFENTLRPTAIFPHSSSRETIRPSLRSLEIQTLAQTLNWQAGHGCQPGLATVLTLNRRAAAAVRPRGSDSELFSLKVGRFFLRDSLF